MKKINSCIVCGFAKFRSLFLARDRMFNLPGIFTLKKCERCSLVFISPQPSFSELKMHYPTSYYSYTYNTKDKGDTFGIVKEYLINHYYKPNLASSIFAKVIKNVPAMPKWSIEKKFLDIGCGTGDTMFLLKKLG